MIRPVFLAALLLAPMLAGAQVSKETRFGISAGWFITDRDTEIRLDDTSGRGTVTDLEDDFGLDRRSEVFRLDGCFRFQGPHRLDFSYFDLSRSSFKRIESEIRWGDEVFPIDSAVFSEFDLEITKAAYTYEFRESETGYLGVTAGLYVADFGSRLNENNLGLLEISSFTAPLPVLGLRGEHQFSERWNFRAAGEFFFLEVDDYKGSLFDLFASIDYAMSDSWSIGVGFNSVRLNVRARKTNFDGRIKWRYNGALLFLKFDF